MAAFADPNGVSVAPTCASRSSWCAKEKYYLNSNRVLSTSGVRFHSLQLSANIPVSYTSWYAMSTTCSGVYRVDAVAVNSTAFSICSISNSID